MCVLGSSAQTGSADSRGIGGIRAGKFAEALRLLSRAVASGSREAQFGIGQTLRRWHGRDLQGARRDGLVPLIRRAAEQGHTVAQYQQSLFYQFGRANRDPNTIDEWYRIASVVNKETADRNIEILSPNGLTGECDEAQALHLTLAAANQGLPAAQANATLFYL